MIEGLRKLYTGDFNYWEGVEQKDGSLVITLSKEGEDKAYRFRVKDLYGEHEEVLEHEVIETKTPKHILDRMKEAKEHGSKSSAKSG